VDRNAYAQNFAPPGKSSESSGYRRAMAFGGRGDRTVWVPLIHVRWGASWVQRFILRIRLQIRT